MIIFLLLLGISCACFFVLSRKISLKIPELIAIPDQVITVRLEEDSARLRLLILNIRAFYGDGRIKLFFWEFTEKTFRRLHITLLRVDNLVVGLIERVKSRTGARSEKGSGEIPETNTAGRASEKYDSSVSRPQRISEIRFKK